MAYGGLFGLDRVEWFNGSLFQDDAVLPLEADDLKLLEEAAGLDWSAIEPAIFGTLFERGLDPSKRSQLGAHYTDPAMIEQIIRAVITQPLLAEWAEVRDQIAEHLSTPLPAHRSAQRQRRASRPSLFPSLPIAGRAEIRERTPRRAGDREAARWSGECSRHREEPVCGGACPRDRLDRGNPVDATEGIRSFAYTRS